MRFSKMYSSETISFLIRDPKELYKEFTIQAESENGGVVNDAVFKRNRMVEERFGIEIKNEVFPDLEEWNYATSTEAQATTIMTATASSGTKVLSTVQSTGRMRYRLRSEERRRLAFDSSLR